MTSVLGKLAVLVIGVAIGAAGLLLWNREKDASFAPLIAGFEEKNELIVFAAQIATVVNNTDEGLIDLLDADQTAIIPASVTYAIDLSKLTGRDISWDDQNGRLTITVPPVRVLPPNFREQEAKYFRQGVWTPRTTEKLARLNSTAAAKQAVAMANAPVLIGMAREAAKKAVAATAEAYLLGMGRRNAQVTVLFNNSR